MESTRSSAEVRESAPFPDRLAELGYARCCVRTRDADGNGMEPLQIEMCLPLEWQLDQRERETLGLLLSVRESWISTKTLDGTYERIIKVNSRIADTKLTDMRLEGTALILPQLETIIEVPE